MRIEVLTITKVSDVQTLPDGVYSGEMGGNLITVRISGETYHIKTRNGIRCMDCPCTVTIRDGLIINIELL